MVTLKDMLSKSGDSLEVVHLEMIEDVTAMEICKPIPPVLYPIFWHD